MRPILPAMPPLDVPSHASPSGTGQFPAAERESFATEELAVVLSHYDIGVLQSVAKFPRGSRKAPKLLITSECGRFILKRRARGKDDPQKVAFAHALQAFLAEKQFPLPQLIATRTDGQSMLQWQGAVYELFEYISGQAYPQTLEATYDSGRVLGLFHKLLETFVSAYDCPTASYHNQRSIEQAFTTISAKDAALHLMLQTLQQLYREAAQRGEDNGIASWPTQYVHADWHPGNMLFRENHVVAVIDYDSCRRLPRIIDIANGALQFSIITAGEDVGSWPDYPDESRFKRFIRGYDQLTLLSRAEVRVMPALMVEALIAQSILPMAVSSSMRSDAAAFLRMVERKVNWLMQSAGKLVDLLEI